MACVMTLDYLRTQAEQGQRSDFDRFMGMVPDAPPLPGDEVRTA